MKYLHVFYCFILVTGMFSCKLRTSGNKTTSRHESGLTEQQRLDFKYLFFEAMRYKTNGEVDKAREKLQQALKIDPHNAATRYELSKIYVELNQSDLARSNGEAAIRLDPKNLWYKRWLAELYQKDKMLEKAILLMKEIHTAEPSDTECLSDLVLLNIWSGHNEEALKFLQKLEEMQGPDMEITSRRKEIYLRMKKPEKALNEVQRMIELFPEETAYRTMLADLYIEINQTEKAIEQYHEIERKDSLNPDVHFLLSNLYRKLGDNEKSFQSLKKAFTNPEASIEFKLQVLGSYLELIRAYPELLNQALELCERLIKTHPSDARSHAIYGDVLMAAGNEDQALEQYEISLETDKSRFEVWSRVLYMENNKGNHQKVIDMSEEVIDLFPNQPGGYLMKAFSAMELKKPEIAEESLKSGLVILVDNDELSVQFQAALGDCYHMMGKHSDSDQAYENALKIDSDNAYVLNNYAYYLSLRKEKLDRAADMAEKCNKIQPGNPSYQDTYAWVLFQKQDFSKALVWIDKALESGGESNSTIIEHKGDILWKLGEKDQAVIHWKKAQSMGAAGENLKRKIAERNYFD